MFDIKIIDKESEFYGQSLKGSCLYYDIKHTGDSDDLYIAETKDGRKINLLSSQIDEEYYRKQELQEVRKQLGVGIGDNVIILEGGSGSYSRDWEKEGIHVVTNIDSTGHVTFDGGRATIFRPRLQLVNA